MLEAEQQFRRIIGYCDFVKLATRSNATSPSAAAPQARARRPGRRSRL